MDGRHAVGWGGGEAPNTRQSVIFQCDPLHSVAKVTLDMETFKALASQTRLQVLRALDERRKTLSELSKGLELNKATVHEHLQLLVAVGLVKKRDDEGRKWIYYELTWQGERLLHPQDTTTFAVLLGFSVAAAGGGVFMLGRALDWWMAEQSLKGTPEGAPGGAPDEGDPEAADAPADDDAAGDTAQQSTADESGEGNGTGDGAPADGDGDADGRSLGDGDAADTDSSPWWSMDDPDGILALLLLATAVLLAVLGNAVRRRRR